MRRVLNILAASLALLFVIGAGNGWPAPAALAVAPMPAEIEEQIERAVAFVSVQFWAGGRAQMESGSAFFVTPTLLVTNRHVVTHALTMPNAALSVRIWSGTLDTRVLPAQIEKTNSAADLALLSIATTTPPVTPLRIHPELPSKQTEVYAFGFPLGTLLDRSQYGPNVCLRRGYISRLINDGKQLEADMNIDQGLSGGPLVDSQGFVRGVIKAMAGSNYNAGFAAIAIASPVLLAFLREAGVPATLADGSLLPAAQPIPPPSEQAPRPRVGFEEDLWRACFALGAALRLNTLVATVLALENAPYSSDLRAASQNNARLIVTQLRRLGASPALLQQAEELEQVFQSAQPSPADVRKKAEALERACDEWMAEQNDDKRLQYEMAAWLTELSLGVLDEKAQQDSRTCAYFIQQAEQAGASREYLALLGQLQKALQAFGQAPHEDLRRAVMRQADRLIGLGSVPLPTASRNPLAKQATETPPASPARNPIRLPF